MLKKRTKKKITYLDNQDKKDFCSPLNNLIEENLESAIIFTLPMNMTSYHPKFTDEACTVKDARTPKLSRLGRITHILAMKNI